MQSTFGRTAAALAVGAAGASRSSAPYCPLLFAEPGA